MACCKNNKRKGIIMQKKKDKTRPVYLEMAEELENKIKAKSYQPGEKLPSVEELSIKYAVHKNTVKNAFKTLREKGLVRNHPGVGIVVREDLKFAIKVALILPVGYHHLGDIILGVNESLKNYESSVEVMLYRTPEEMSLYLKYLKEKDFSGAIIRPDFSGSGYGDVCKIQNEKFPLVLIENFYPDSNGWHVDTGAFDAGFLAVKQLNKMGYLPIAAVCSSDRFGEAFIDGYKEAHTKLKLVCSRNNVRYLSGGDSAGNLSMELMKMKKPPGAIIYSNPDYAVSGYKALKENGSNLRCIKLLSFGEIINSELFENNIISIKLDFMEIGRKAGKLLIDQIAMAPNQSGSHVEKVKIELKL
jgi:DNA-binding LacI/PurR family transcriptional regulator